MRGCYQAYDYFRREGFVFPVNVLRVIQDLLLELSFLWGSYNNEVVEYWFFQASDSIFYS